MVNNSEATNEFTLTPEDISVALKAHPEAAQAAQINLLKRLIVKKDNLITKQYGELADLQQQLDELTSDK